MMSVPSSKYSYLLSNFKIENPKDEVFDKGKDQLNDFISKVNQFEEITNASLKDLWRIKDVGFQPL
jgi:hypothetical protein